MGRSAEPAASAARSLFGDRGANTRLVVHSTPGSDRNENAVPQPAGTLSKLLISNLPLHSTANAWGSYGIFTTPPLPLSFSSKWIANPPSSEVGPIKASFEPIVLSRWRTNGVWCATGLHWGVCRSRSRPLAVRRLGLPTRRYCK